MPAGRSRSGGSGSMAFLSAVAPSGPQRPFNGAIIQIRRSTTRPDFLSRHTRHGNPVWNSKMKCICPGNKVPFYCPVHGRVENPNWPPLKETDRPYRPPGSEIAAQAFDLDECHRQRDPDGE